MKTLKLSVIGIIVAIALAAFAVTAKPAAAQAWGTTNLGDLLVTNGLFAGYSAPDLAGLIAVDSVSGYGMGGTAGTNNLNDLIVMNGLFSGYSAPDLAGLIAVDNMYY